MRARTIRAWSFVHTWTSIVSTLFLLLLCLTGLPLIFHEEIDGLLHETVAAAQVEPGTPPADLDKVIANGMAKAPGEFLQFLIWDRDDPNVIFLSVARAQDAPSNTNRFLRVDAHTAGYLDAPPSDGHLTYYLLKLHTDMFAGLPGKLFLGFMGLLFVVAIISGIVVYTPAMRKLDFGTVRTTKSRILKWLDIHNLVGAVTIVWAVVVGFTGVINTWADLVLKYWQADQLTAMVGPYKGAPLPRHFTSVEKAVETAQAKLPAMTPYFIAYPGTAFTSSRHYAVFMRGKSPLTSRLMQPVLIDASDGRFSDTRVMPWYVKALLLSQPLHFGDYGGMPLKIVWALLDILTIVVLGSGVYLWVARRFGRRRIPRAVSVPAE
ncbi:MAG: PepSY domain-containing protein [Proteobacteria bacterium]|nr:PepSY domain-containing protein [Pseudomonadota bacterium]